MPRRRHPDGVHSIEVPRGWSVEQAWEHERRGDPLPAGPRWHADVWVLDGRAAGFDTTGSEADPTTTDQEEQA